MRHVQLLPSGSERITFLFLSSYGESLYVGGRSFQVRDIGLTSAQKEKKGHLLRHMASDLPLPNALRGFSSLRFDVN